MSAFASKMLAAEADATAPDGTAVRLLSTLARGSMAHFELPAGATSHAVAHRTVEEIWYVLSGVGEIWRRQGETERVEPMRAGVSLAIPLGMRFQFRAATGEPLRFLAVTMPPWPGADEAYAVAGPWAPTIPAG